MTPGLISPCACGSIGKLSLCVVEELADCTEQGAPGELARDMDLVHDRRWYAVQAVDMALVEEVVRRPCPKTVAEGIGTQANSW